MTIDELLSKARPQRARKAVMKQYQASKEHLEQLTADRDDNKRDLDAIINELMDAHAAQAEIKRSLTKEDVANILDSRIYSKPCDPPHVPFADKSFNPTPADTKFNICLPLAINLSLQGAFFTTVGQTLRRTDTAKRGRKHMAANLILNRGIQLKNLTPLVRTRWKGKEQWLALEECGKLDADSISIIKRTPARMTEFATQQKTQTLIAIVEYISLGTSAVNARRAFIRLEVHQQRGLDMDEPRSRTAPAHTPGQPEPRPGRRIRNKLQ